MRDITLLLFALTTSVSSAQIINGSFESAGMFDTTGWAWQCTDPEAVMPGAPGAGDFAIRKPFSNTQGCFYENLTQEITGVTPGDIYTLSGWVMQESGFFSAQPGLYFAEENGGVFSLQNGITTSNNTWTWLQVTDTLFLTAGVTHQVVLHTGMVGGPAFGWSRFDGIDLEKSIATGLGSHGRIDLPYYLDAANGTLTIHVGNSSRIDQSLFDVAGSVLPFRGTRSGSSLMIDLRGLGAGIYFARITSPDGEGVIRFAVE